MPAHARHEGVGQRSQFDVPFSLSFDSEPSAEVPLVASALELRETFSCDLHTKANAAPFAQASGHGSSSNLNNSGLAPGETDPLRAISTPQCVRSISSVECASGSMLKEHPSSRARRCHRQSRSSRQGLALISTATPCWRKLPRRVPHRFSNPVSAKVPSGHIGPRSSCKGWLLHAKCVRSGPPDPCGIVHVHSLSPRQMNSRTSSG